MQPLMQQSAAANQWVSGSLITLSGTVVQIVSISLTSPLSEQQQVNAQQQMPLQQQQQLEQQPPMSSHRAVWEHNSSSNR
ncbi:GL24538 [Drosophila persimilis]|uniref:GL24538 n=2 Tax=Drosophila persimilis TaxID=7234 RepID=B4G4J2_DROPE|nr:GL24538 [Drosophila persimilis]